MNKQWERTKLRVAAIGSTISIVLCGIALILWLLSFFVGVQVSVRNGAGTRYALLTVPNGIGLVVVRKEPPGNITVDFTSQSDAKPNTAGVMEPLHWYWHKPTQSTVGFGKTTGEGTVFFDEVNASMTGTYVGRFVPGLILVLLTAILPLWWWRAQRLREYRYEHNLCIYCGADMSTSPYRCPKCGREQPW